MEELSRQMFLEVVDLHNTQVRESQWGTSEIGNH